MLVPRAKRSENGGRGGGGGDKPSACGFFYYLPDRVYDGEDVREKRWVDALLLGLDDEVVEGQIEAQEACEAGGGEERKPNVLERLDELGELKRLRRGVEAGLDRETGAAAEREYDEAEDAHRPREADARDQVAHEDGQHDAADRRARHHEAQGRGAVLEEPGDGRVGGRVEHGGGPDAAHDALCKDDLVVLGRHRKDHETEREEEGADRQDPARPVAVEQATHDEVRARQEKGLHGRDPRYVGGAVMRQRALYVVLDEDAGAVDQAVRAEEKH